MRDNATALSRTVVADMVAALMFLSRVPLPVRLSDQAGLTLGQSLRLAPLAGVVIACVPSAVLLAGTACGLPTTVTAALAIAGIVLATGGLHEDGLADVADGFGGGASAGRKLAIMRDSRIGTFGALALGLSLILRVACLTALLERHGPASAVAGLIAAAALSRSLMLFPLWALPPARSDGLAHAAGAIETDAIGTAAGLAATIAALAGLHEPGRMLVAIAGAALASLGMTGLARRQIGGVTGDVVGATQQLSEIAVLIVLCGGAVLR